MQWIWTCNLNFVILNISLFLDITYTYHYSYCGIWYSSDFCVAGIFSIAGQVILMLLVIAVLLVYLVLQVISVLLVITVLLALLMLQMIAVLLVFISVVGDFNFLVFSVLTFMIAMLLYQCYWWFSVTGDLPITGTIWLYRIIFKLLLIFSKISRKNFTCLRCKDGKSIFCAPPPGASECTVDITFRESDSTFGLVQVQVILIVQVSL